MFRETDPKLLNLPLFLIFLNSSRRKKLPVFYNTFQKNQKYFKLFLKNKLFLMTS